jgi:hypothetical protein
MRRQNRTGDSPNTCLQTCDDVRAGTLSALAEMEARYPFGERAVYCRVLHDCGPPPDDYSRH